MLDGYCFENKTVYEFQGCLFHGCLKCNGDKTFNVLLQCTNEILRLRTETKIKYLKSVLPDFKIEEIWEHDWDKFCIEHSLNIQAPKESLNIREALYGGRTNAFRLYYKCLPNEKIFYYDFTSLYPAVQKYGIYPMGHPTIITENFDYKKK